MGVGDSKTVQIPSYLDNFPSLAGGVPVEYPLRMAHSGYGTYDFGRTKEIDTYLAAGEGTPNYVFINIGVNDQNRYTFPADEAAWKVDYLYIVDEINIKYPNAKIYLMRPAGRDISYIAELHILIEWVVSQRPTFCFSPDVLDEAVFLENGDDYETYTSDGIHPNSAGNLLTAQKWLQAIGLLP